MAGTDDFFGTSLIAYNPFSSLLQATKSPDASQTQEPATSDPSSFSMFSPLANYYMTSGGPSGMRTMSSVPTTSPWGTGNAAIGTAPPDGWYPSLDTNQFAGLLPQGYSMFNVPGQTTFPTWGVSNTYATGQFGPPFSAPTGYSWSYEPENGYGSGQGGWFITSQRPVQGSDAVYGVTPPRDPSQEHAYNEGQSFNLIGNGSGGASDGSDSGGFGDVGDLGPIRDALQTWLLGRFFQPAQSYPGSLNIPQNQMLQDAGGVAQTSAGLFGNIYSRALGTSDSMTPMLMDAWNRALQSGAASSATNRELMQTGGAPDITNALNDIRTKGMLDLQDQLAQIKEQYGQMGLGRSSDTIEAQSRGAARGVANINQQQSQLMASIMDAAANRRLGAASNEQQLATMLPSVFSSLMNAQQQPLNTAIGAAGGMQGAAGTMAGVGQMEQQRLLQNLLLPYQEFTRTSQNYPLLQSALAFATGFPPQQPIVPEQNGLWGALGQIGGSFMSALPFLMASSRKLKEDIEPLDTNVTKKLKKLNIYTWKYIGDKVKHVGPMAEEFKETFGVGDGVTLNPVDLFGVMLAATKEMAHATA